MKGLYLKIKNNFYTLFFTLNFPIFLTQIILIISGIINTTIFGQLGENTLAAVAIVDKINGVYWPILASISTVISIFFIQNSNKKEKIKKIFIINNVLMISLSFICFILIFFLAEKIISLYTQEFEVIKKATFYLKATFIGNILATISFSIITYINGMGKVKETSVIGTIQLLFNSFIYFLLIIILKETRFHSIIGISLGIVIAKLFEMIIFIILYKFKFSLKNYKVNSKKIFDLKFIKKIEKLIIPLFLNNLFFMIAVNLIFLSYSRKGTQELAAMGISDNLASNFFLLFQGVVTSAKIMIGNLLGKRKMFNAYIYSKATLKILFGFTLVFSLLMNIVAKFYIQFFKISQYTKELSLKLIALASFFFIIKVINSLIVESFLRMGGDIKKPIINDMIGIYCFGVLISYFFREISIVYLFILVNTNELIRCFLNFSRYKEKIWLKKIS